MRTLDEVLARLPGMKDLLAKHPHWQEIVRYPGIQYFGIKEDMGLCIAALEEARDRIAELEESREEMYRFQDRVRSMKTSFVTEAGALIPIPEEGEEKLRDRTPKLSNPI